MEWIEPKTDWKVEYDGNGNYIGDYLNAKDLNRMLSNLNYLIDDCVSIYDRNDLFHYREPDVTVGELLHIDLLLGITYYIQLINRYVRSTEVKKIIDTRVLRISRDNTPTWEFYNAVEQIMKLEHEQMIKTVNDKRKLKYRLGIPNTGGF